MTVEAILKRKGPGVVTTAPATTIKAAAELMKEKNIAALLVMSGETTAGIITERDIVRAFAAEGGAIANKPVQDIMTKKLITGTPQDSVKHVMEIMTNKRIRHFPVYRDGKLAGLISIGDAVRHRVQDLELEKNVLRDAYISAR
jgi:CBS domain-containing protein